MSFLISGLNIANGASFWIRWVSFDITSADDGLAVDDFSLTPLGTPVPEPGTLALLGLGLLGLGLRAMPPTQRHDGTREPLRISHS